MIFTVFLHSTLLLALGGVAVFLLTRITMVRSIPVLRFAWAAVLLSGLLWIRVPIKIPVDESAKNVQKIPVVIPSETPPVEPEFFPAPPFATSSTSPSAPHFEAAATDSLPTEPLAANDVSPPVLHEETLGTADETAPVAPTESPLASVEVVAEPDRTSARPAAITISVREILSRFFTLDFLALVWASGIALLLFRRGAAWFYSRRILATCRDAAEEPLWRRVLEEQGIPCEKVRLLFSSDFGPGLVRTSGGYAIIVPETLWEDSSGAVREGLLRHELSHYRHGDPLKSLAVHFIKTLHWFNPVAHFAAARFDEAAEWRCDVEAFGSTEHAAADLAETLLAFRDCRPVTVWVASPFSKNPLMTRVRKLDEYRNGKKESRMKKFSIIALVSLLFCLGLVRLVPVARTGAAEPEIATPSFTVQNLEAADRIADAFLASLVENRYDKAASEFSGDLLLQCNEQRLRGFFESIKRSRVETPGAEDVRYFDRPDAGALKSFDKPTRTDHPGGPLWESTLRYENAVLQIRMALRPLDDGGAQLAAFETRAVPDEPSPERRGDYFNGPEIGRRLGLDHSVEITFLGPDGKPVAPETASALRIFVFIKTDEEREPNVSHVGDADLWTDPADGSRWLSHWGERGYSPEKKDKVPGIVLYDALPEGTYRIAATNARDRTVDDEGFVGFSGPVVLDAKNPHGKISLRLIHGGTLKVVVRDPETGRAGESVTFERIDCGAAPTQITGAWVSHNVRNAVNGLFPGRYTFTLQQYPREPDEIVFDFGDKKYTADIVDGKETVVDVELPSRSQTREELDERWPFLITGTVKDLDGKGLSGAEITFWGYVGHRPGRKTTTTDENGNYAFRFAKHSITAMWASRSEEPTPEKPDVLAMSISAERPGYVWKGVRDGKGEIVSDDFISFNEKRSEYSRVDGHALTAFMPKPSTEHDPERAVYALEPKTVDIVLQPAVRLRGVLPFDEPVVPADPKDRWSSSTGSSATFDMPRSETASGQPIFYGTLEETDGVWRFDLSVLPYDIDVSLGMSTRLPASWKGDATIAKTDLFKLPPVGEYTVKLRWDVQEKDGRKLRQLRVDSVVDADGKAVDIGQTKPLVPTAYLLNRWTVEGTVRDDRGEPVAGAEIGFSRHSGWKFYPKTSTTTDADGKYRIELAAENRYPAGHKLHGPEDGELYVIRAKREGFTQRNFEAEFIVFLSDAENPAAETFAYQTLSTKNVAARGKAFTADLTMDRNVKVEGVLSDKNGKPLGDYTLLIEDGERIDSDLRKEYGIGDYDFTTDAEGNFVQEWFSAEKPFWFRLYERNPEDRDMLRTHGLVLAPGEVCKVDLRLETAEDGSRHLAIRSVRDVDGKEITEKILREDMRARPKLGEEDTKKGRKIVDKLGDKIASMFGITDNTVDTLRYKFHRGDAREEITVDSYSGQRTAETRGITFSTPLEDLVARPWDIFFRAIEDDGKETRLWTTFKGRYAYGNGISGTWSGYSSGGCDEVLLVLDNETGLPKRLEGRGLKEEYFDWTPLGDADKGLFVPKRILVRRDDMRFDFRFTLHDGDVWLFDRSVVPDGEAEKTICRIDEVRIERVRWASEEQENRVREALRKFKTANEYWLSWYPEDLPEFGYTFHMREHDDEVLSYEDIKAATNWYAEFKRKGISYIGVSRLLVIDIDALRCRRVVEDGDVLEFDFTLKHEWMNAVGNGISGTWLGWFNGGIGKGTAVLDTKTMTLREIRTTRYDERYSDYVEIKPGRYVPGRIVIDKHNGDREKSGQGNNLYFDFRFKTYEPCLWLFDRSVETDEDGKEKDGFPVWIDGVTVNGKPGVEKREP